SASYRTITVIGFTPFDPYPYLFHRATSGCGFPAESVARERIAWRPGPEASQIHSQACQPYSETAGSTFASAHVSPPSIATSTLTTWPIPDQARPRTFTGPTGTVSPSSGDVIVDLTRIVVTGVGGWPSP